MLTLPPAPPVWPRPHHTASTPRHLVLFLASERSSPVSGPALYGAHASGPRGASSVSGDDGGGGGGGEGAGGEPGGGGAGGGGDGAAGVERGRGGGGGRDGADRAGGGHGVRDAGVVGVRGHLLLPRALRRDHVRAHPGAHVARPRRAGDPPAQRHGRREGAGWSDPKPYPFHPCSPLVLLDLVAVFLGAGFLIFLVDVGEWG